MIRFARYRYVSVGLSLLVIIGSLYYTYNIKNGFAHSMDFDGGIQLELEFPKSYDTEKVRKFFKKMKPSLDVQVTRYTDPEKNIYKIEMGRDIIVILEGEDEVTKKANTGFFNYVISFFYTEQPTAVEDEAAGKTAEKKTPDAKIKKDANKASAVADKKTDSKDAKTAQAQPVKAEATDAISIIKKMVDAKWQKESAIRASRKRRRIARESPGYTPIKSGPRWGFPCVKTP